MTATITVMVLLLLAACIEEPEPTPATAASPTAVSVVERPSASPTPTALPSSTPTRLPTTTSTPTTTPSSTPSPFPTLTPLPELIWADDTEIVAEFDTLHSTSVRWSPVASEFVANGCSVGRRPSDDSVYLINTSDFNLTPITPSDYVCEPITNMIWTLDGQQIIYPGLFPEDHPFHPSNYGWDNSALWITDRDGSQSHPINYDTAFGRWPVFIGWVDNQTLAYHYYSGGGHSVVTRLNVVTGERFGDVIVHIGGGYSVHGHYLSANTGMIDYSYISAVAIDDEIVHTEPIYSEGAFMICLSDVCGVLPCERTPCLEVNSRFEDWRPDTGEMLVLTWPLDDLLIQVQDGYSDKADPNIQTQLQLWDVDEESVELLVDGGIFGRFSSDGRYLAYHTLRPAPQLHILDVAENQVLFSTASAEPDFSWNSATFSWSPGSKQLIFRDHEDRWHFLQIPSMQLIPIVLKSGDRLFNPRWSYDGRYLSVSVLHDHFESTLAVIQAP